MAIVDIIKSWFGKNKKPTIAPSPTPTQTQAKKTIATPSKAATFEKLETQESANPSNASSNNLMTMLNNPQTAFSVKQIALQKVEDANLLAELAAHHKIAKIRQQAANQLNDFTLIHKVLNQVKHSDKGVYRILRQKIEAQELQQKGQADYTQRLTQICADLEHHLQSAHTPLFAAKVQSLQQQWQQLTEQKSYTLSNALQQRFDAASTQAQQKVTAEQSKKALFEQQKTVANAFTTLQADVLLIDNVNNINQLSEKLNALSYDWQYCTQHTEADTQLVQQVQKSQQTLQKYSDLFQQTAPHIEAMLQHHQQLVDSPINQTAYDALQTLLQNTELLNTKLTLPALFSSIIDSFNTAQKALAAYQNAQEKNEEVTVNTPISTPNKKTASHPELEKLLLQIAECFNQGQSKEADKILRQAQKYAKANHLFDPRLGDWLQELQKMKDWAGFAILPKKEELVAQMKTLAEQAESQTDPLTQLDKIKLLQAEWQALGTVYNDAEKVLWEAFKDLSQNAYAPCQRYFDEQNAIQEQNATARQQLCDELQQYLDNLPNEVNWQGHIAILKQAREDWQKYHPVEAKKHKQLQSRFTRIIKALEDKLHAEYELQETKKRALISQATQLLNHENMYEACQQAKELQNTWKTLGFCGHQKEQALWEEFRQHCDALFTKRGAQKEAQKLEEQATTQQAEHILTELNTLLNTPEHSPNITQVNGFIQAFQALFLPKEVNHALRKRFSVLAQQWQSYLDTQVNVQKQAQLKQIETALELCVSAEQHILAGTSVTLGIVLTWQGLVVPQPFKSTLQKRWQAISSLKKLSAEDTLTREQKALDDCLLLELLLDIDSPDTERLARTAKKIELFEQQNYPKTTQEAQALVSQTLQNLLLISCLSNEVNTQINQRLHLVLQSSALSKLL